MTYMCPVCGFPELTKDPEHIASFEICPSCHFQFRVDDDDKGFTYDQWRKNWIDEGMPWMGKGKKPPVNWDPKKQLENLPSAS